MPDHPVSRRTVALALAGGVMGAKLVSVDSSGESPTADPNPGERRADAETSPTPRERQLLSPLVVGSRLLTWEIVAIEPITHGALRVGLRDESGAVFGVEILARDASLLAPRPPAQTDR